MSGFPNVMCAVDGTHVAIKAPTDNDNAGVNRSNTTQLTCTFSVIQTHDLIKCCGSLARLNPLLIYVETK